MAHLFEGRGNSRSSWSVSRQVQDQVVHHFPPPHSEARRRFVAGTGFLRFVAVLPGPGRVFFLSRRKRPRRGPRPGPEGRVNERDNFVNSFFRIFRYRIIPRIKLQVSRGRRQRFRRAHCSQKVPRHGSGLRSAVQLPRTSASLNRVALSRRRDTQLSPSFRHRSGQGIRILSPFFTEN